MQITTQEIKQLRQKFFAEAIEAVEEEEELPGEMPQQMFEMVKGLDRDAMTEYCRILVRVAKENIVARLKARS